MRTLTWASMRDHVPHPSLSIGGSNKNRLEREKEKKRRKIGWISDLVFYITVYLSNLLTTKMSGRQELR